VRQAGSVSIVCVKALLCRVTCVVLNVFEYGVAGEPTDDTMLWFAKAGTGRSGACGRLSAVRLIAWSGYVMVVSACRGTLNQETTDHSMPMNCRSCCGTFQLRQVRLDPPVRSANVRRNRSTENSRQKPTETNNPYDAGCQVRCLKSHRQIHHPSVRARENPFR